MKKSLMISRILLLSWKNQAFYKFQQITFLKYLIPLIGLMIFGLLCIFAYSQVYPLVNGLMAEGETNRIINGLLSPIFMSIALYTSFILIFFHMMSPERSVIEQNLHWMPVKLWQIKLGYYLPFIGSITIFISVFTLPLIIASGIGMGFTAGGVVLLIYSALIHIIFFSFATLVFYEIFSFSLRRLLNISGLANKSMSCVLSLAPVLALFITLVVTIYQWLSVDTAAINALNFSLLNVAAIINPEEVSFLQVLLANGLPVISLAALMLFANLPSRISESRNIMFLRRIPFPKNRFLTIFVKELKEIFRHDEHLIMFVFMIALSVFIVTIDHFSSLDLEPYTTVFIIFAWMSSGAFANSSYGRGLQMTWMKRILSYPAYGWIFAKWLANFIFILFFSSLLCLIFSSTLDIQFKDFIRYAPAGILAMSFSYCMGIIFPYTKDHPFAMAFSAAFSIFIGLPAIYAVLNYIGFIQEHLIVIISITILTLFIVSYILEKWRDTHDLTV
ncbi:hypothetical protein FZC79_18705 [Rossellomorea vietnamensis]|uniref:Uncharacterized protein n=1 Tax=Rossellomorea vietnamensis TaxID=218284 RepID=A0A5D4KBH0_9BACI|nr:hypothetical protein [Rossellomorea vietnamensis]TYR73473.1 hypothetical protein FZC79_18705 [Rossellomorea vietnamensis]